VRNLAAHALRWQTLLCLAPLLAAACAIIFVRAALGFQFPVPWPDETGFVAPAFDFARTGSFFDPGMNPDRVVMWMPPGYMVALAALFRLFGYSYALARWFSAVSAIVALAITSWLAWNSTRGWPRVAAALAIGLAFTSPYLLIDSNLARMEMPFAALMLLALAAAMADRLYIAGALAAAGALVHFNAAYFMPPIALAFALRVAQRRMPWPDRADWAAMGATALAMAAYAAQIAMNWPGFKTDMGFQFDLKRLSGLHDPLHPLWPVLAALALAWLVVARQHLRPGSMAALFGLAFIIMAHNGHEIWYDYGQPLGFALIALGALTQLQTIRVPLAVFAGALALTGATGWHMTATLRPLMPQTAMLHRSVVAPGEISRLRRFIATLPPNATVNFGWTGLELFFLNDLARAGVHWNIIRHSVTQVWPLRPSDWRVVCDSSEWPPLLFAFDIDHRRHGKDGPCDIYQGKPGA
jgi:4-amino-4-deoxy-L-arabinose transferase-like glycosyltransferase